MGTDPVVLVVGDANPDLVLRGAGVPRFGQAEVLVDDADLVIGGSAAIMACGLVQLGVPTALAAVVGDDLFGSFVRDELTARGVDTRWLRVDDAVRTAVTVVLSAGDRAILTYAGAIAETTVRVVPDLGAPGALRHVHVASYFLMPRLAPDLPAVLQAVRAAGLTSTLDTNWDPAERWAGVVELLPYVGTLLPNETELTALTRLPDVDTAAAAVTATGCSVALKAGKDGGVMWRPDGERLTAPGIAVDVVDTTGAGDSFDAGYVSALLDGLSPQACLARAAACGSLSTRAAGGTAAQPTRAELGSLGIR